MVRTWRLSWGENREKKILDIRQLIQTMGDLLAEVERKMF
jgi:hypothetical protein